MTNSCWVIKVTYLTYKETNFNEAFWSYDKCITAIQKKLENKSFTVLNDFTYKDLDNEIIYEAKLVTIFE